MLTPSYSDLMESIRQSGKVDPRVASRYTVVLAAAKRARQLTEGAEPLTYAPTDRAVSIAVKEMNEGKLRIKVQEELMDGSQERMVKDQYKYRVITALSKDDLREDLKDDYTPSRTYTIEEDDDVAGSDLFPDDPFVVVADDVDVDIDEPKDDFDLYEDIDDEDMDPEESFDE
ncbi:MAG: DNA-directed RNA polymerase subunit omega [Firmicutes bacterium]|nr:DNA-directed RNA polymerase subunit omega [Bacillota bacterium]